MEIGLVRKIDINKEMQQSYLDYAMSVIVSRALPDARDGLKPVHRRILFAMYDMGLRPNTSYKKSARVVGEVLGKYHPHSDAAVYDAMARMAQDFSMRCPLVDGQGNFGSVDGDPPAAMRYTEARLTSSAIDMMVDIQKETVNFVANFDETMSEPSVLPAAIPNLLVNGATGIAVGMSTSVPPHNLGEVVNALIYMLSNWAKIDDITIEDLMRFIQGPDFPTGGIIVGEEGAEDRLSSAYGSGKGRITVQARAHVEDIGRGRQHIIVTELPYMTNKASLVERIAKLARTGTIEGISDLRDESDRQGMRIVIELGKNVDPDDVLTDLYKRTPMQSTFSIIMLALVDGEPRMLTLKQALKVYLDHRLEIIRRRSEHDLEKARQRAHLLEGYRIALDNLDEIIGIIRRSRDVDTARNNLIKRYKLSDIQANAILDMPLKRLSALERKKIDIEHKELQKTIKGLLALLKAPKKMREKVAEELETVRENYGDRRRTQIVRVKEGVKLSQVLTASDLAPDETVWVTVTEDGKISRSLQDKSPRLSGKSAPKFVLRVNTRDTLYLVAENGEAAVIAVHALPDSNDPDQGVQVSKVCALRDSDTLADMFTIPSGVENKEKYYVLGVTKGGMVKKSSLEELPGPSSQTFTLIKVKGGDQLIRVLITDGASDLILATAKGMAIRFTEDAVRPMGLVAAGVNAIKLKAGDLVIGAELINPKYEVFLLASDGKAKRVKPSQFPIQGRYGQGVSAWKLEAGLKLNAMVVNKPNYKVIVHMARLASKAVRLDEAPVRGRPSNGKQVIEVKVNDQIVAVTLPAQTTLGLSKNVEETDLVFADDPKPTQIQMELKGSKKTAKKKGSKKSSSGKKKSAKK